MKIKGEFIMRELVGEILLVPVARRPCSLRGMITLNPDAAQICASWSRALLTRRFFGASWTSSTWRRIPHARIWTDSWKKCGAGFAGGMIPRPHGNRLFTIYTNLTALILRNLAQLVLAVRWNFLYNRLAPLSGGASLASEGGQSRNAISCWSPCGLKIL